MSANTSRAPVRTIDPPVAKNVNGLVTTASPGPMSSAINASSSASLPEATPIAWRAPVYALHFALEAVHGRTQHELLLGEHLLHGALGIAANRLVLRLEIEQGNPHPAAPVTGWNTSAA